MTSWLLALLLTTANLPAAPGRAVVFQLSDGWAIYDASGVRVEQFLTLEGLAPISASISANGKRLVFAARPAAAEQPRLYLRVDGTTRPLLEASNGYYARPALSHDGAWVFFVHHPLGGPPGQHASMQNAQLYRLQIDAPRSDPEQLTSSPGCKGDPDPGSSGNSVIFNHNTCNGFQYLESLSDGATTRIEGDPTTSLWAPRLSPDKKSIAFLERAFGQTNLRVHRLNTSASTVLYTWPREIESSQAIWSADSGKVFFVGTDGPQFVAVSGGRGK